MIIIIIIILMISLITIDVELGSVIRRRKQCMKWKDGIIGLEYILLVYIPLVYIPLVYSA